MALPSSLALPSSEDTSSTTEGPVPLSKKEDDLAEAFARFHEEKRPNGFDSARFLAEAVHIYRSLRVGKEVHSVALKAVKVFLDRQRIVSDIPSQPDYAALDRTFLSTGSCGIAKHVYGKKLSNIASYVIAYRRGIASTTDDAARRDALLAVARAAKGLHLALRSFDIAALLKHWPAEVAMEGSVTMWPTASGATARASPGDITVAAVNRRRLDALQRLKATLPAIEIAAQGFLQAVTGISPRLPEGRWTAAGGTAGSRRHRQARAIADWALKLRHDLRELDPRTASMLMPGLTSGCSGVDGISPAVARDLLRSVELGARARAAAINTRRGRRAVNDALSMGVEAVARLWVDTHGMEPTYAYKATGFGALCIAMFGPDGLKFTTAEVRVAVRTAITERSRRGTG